ncbi:phosphorylase family protein [Shewanella xiamenensis]|uniref:phosphorylase family protein n=1 Tax=Shewanella xiamenensis TaxID=332186 RepID=UPI001C4FA669|nr:nucleoside phosphorylase [Shewanella xiamenensis]MBW0278813.1 nucleoside phosphorylase [Shewanella xiamenensis]MCT8871318.1 nucleoside phosphorylase [Shewanella xiamenensis]UWH41496.1 nucleoside phosphorylase [Shewanella xiamenensis]
MNVLILEDNNEKHFQIENALKIEISECNVKRSTTLAKFVTDASSKKYDLIITDLIVPLTDANEEPIDATAQIIETIRGNLESPNFSTPVIAITSFDDIASDNFEKYNRLDINIIKHNKDSDEWERAFLFKAKKSIPQKKYDFIIFCALQKEADAFNQLDCIIGKKFIINGIDCTPIKIDEHFGIIIVPPRMGLVNAAITCTKAIDSFSPKLICMSGICAGIDGKANIYDVIISEMCFQHDSGKWSSDGFISEPYSVQIHHKTSQTIKQIISDNDFTQKIKEGVILNRSEYPDNIENLQFNVILSPTSSGSSVIASEEALNTVIEQHRKMTAFEMESYALYEAARQSTIQPKYFSAKSVVDNGNHLKGDNFHRVACILSAKTVFEIVKRGFSTL